MQNAAGRSRGARKVTMKKVTRSVSTNNGSSKSGVIRPQQTDPKTLSDTLSQLEVEKALELDVFSREIRAAFPSSTCLRCSF